MPTLDRARGRRAYVLNDGEDIQAFRPDGAGFSCARYVRSTGCTSPVCASLDHKASRIAGGIALPNFAGELRKRDLHASLSRCQGSKARPSGSVGTSSAESTLRLPPAEVGFNATLSW